MSGVTWMWEARAAPGCGARLLAWVLDALRAGDGEGRPRAEVYRSRSQDAELVVVILHLSPGVGGDAPGAVLPPPPAALLARPPQAWDFEPVALPGDSGA